MYRGQICNLIGLVNWVIKSLWVTLPETNMEPEQHIKTWHPKRTVIFKPSIFRCKLLVSGRVANLVGYNSGLFGMFRQWSLFSYQSYQQDAPLANHSIIPNQKIPSVCKTPPPKKKNITHFNYEFDAILLTG